MTTRSQIIVGQLRDGIIEGDYPGGMRMNEIELAEALEVSRTPIRAALSILAAEGLLRYTPNSGFVVQQFTSSDIEQIYEVRSNLSGLAARLSAEKGLGEERLMKLRSIMVRSREVVDKHEWTEEVRDEWERLNEDFHAIIDSAGNNPHLDAALQRTRDIPILKEIRFRWIDPDSLAQNLFAHMEILDAVASGKQVRAEDLTREHVYRNGQRIVQQWRKIEARKRSPQPGATGQQSPVETTEDEQEVARHVHANSV